MTDDLSFLDGHDDGRLPNGATGRPKCRRHRWAGDFCERCGQRLNPVTVRRGRTSLRAGKEAERAIARAYGGTRTGQYGGPDDVTVGDLFVVQSKATDRTAVTVAFPEWMWDELAKLPRAGGRIPTLIVSDRPGPGHRTRRLVIRLMDDDVALHGEKP